MSIVLDFIKEEIFNLGFFVFLFLYLMLWIGLGLGVVRVFEGGIMFSFVFEIIKVKKDG